MYPFTKSKLTLWREREKEILATKREPMDLRPHGYEQGYLVSGTLLKHPANRFNFLNNSRPTKEVIDKDLHSEIMFVKGDIISYDQLKLIFSGWVLDMYAKEWILKESKLEIEPVSEQGVILQTIDKITG